MKKQLRFLLFAVLAVVMCLMTMLAVSAAQDGDTSATEGFVEANYNYKVVNAGGAATYYLTFDGAFASVPEGGTLYLLKSVDLGSSSVAVTNVNSFTIEGGGNTLNAVLTLTTGNGKTVKINNLVLVSADKALTLAGAGTTFEFTGVTLTAEKGYAICVTAADVSIKMLGSANTVTQSKALVYTEDAALRFSLLVEGGSYTVEDFAYLRQKEQGSVVVKAGTFTVENYFARTNGDGVASFTVGVAGAADSTLTVTCKNLVYTALRSSLTYVQNCGTVTTSDELIGVSGKNVKMTALTLNGGSFSIGETMASLKAAATLAISGGSFEIGGTYYNQLLTYTITGGEFVVTDNTDVEKIDFSKSAKISMASYVYKLTESYTIASSADLVAKALEGFPANTDILSLSFVIDNGAILTITGGEYKFTDKDVIDIINGGVKIVDGVFESNKNVFHCNQGSTATIEIEKGTFKGEYVIQIDKSSTATVLIADGTFNGTRVIQIEDAAKANITINGGSFNGTYAVVYSVANSKTELAISKGTFHTEAGEGVVYAYGAINLNITGGSFTSKRTGMPVFLLRQTSGSTAQTPFTFVLKNATINSYRGIVFTNKDGSLYYDCTFENVKWNNTSTSYGMVEIEQTAVVTMSIAGGSYSAPHLFMAKGTGSFDLTIDGGTCTASTSFISNTSTATISLTVKNGTLKAPAELIATEKAVTLSVEGGTVNAATLFKTEAATVTLNVSGGKIKTTNDMLALGGTAKATVTVTGGTFETAKTVFVLPTGSSATVSGGTFTNPENVFMLGDGVTAVISGGEFTLTGTQSYVFGGNAAGASVTGGSFTVDNFIELVDFSRATKVVIKNSGYFEVTQPGEYVINTLADFAAILSTSGSANFEYPATGWFSLHINAPGVKVIYNLNVPLEVFTEYLVKVSQGEAVFTAGKYTLGTKSAFVVGDNGVLSIQDASFALTGEGSTFLSGKTDNVTIGEDVKISAGNYANVPFGDLYANATITIKNQAVLHMQNKFVASVTTSAQLIAAIKGTLPENMKMDAGVKWINLIIDNDESVVTIERGTYVITGQYVFKIIKGTLNILAGTYQIPGGTIVEMEGGSLNISGGKYYANCLVKQLSGTTEIVVANIEFNRAKPADSTNANPKNAFVFEEGSVSSLTVKAAYITSAGSAIVLNKARVTIDGDATIKNTGKEYLILVNSGSVLTVKDGTYIVGDSAKSPIYSDGASNVRVNIDGGNFVGSKSMPVIYFKNVKTGTNKLKITGGTFFGMRLFVANNSVLEEISLSGLTLNKMYNDKNDTTLPKELMTLQGSAGKINVLTLGEGNNVNVSGTLISVLDKTAVTTVQIKGGTYRAGLSSFNTKGEATLNISATGGITAFAENLIKAEGTSKVQLTINGGDLATAGMDALYFNKLDTATIEIDAITGSFSINQNAGIPDYSEYDFKNITVHVNSSTLEIKTAQNLTLGPDDTALFAEMINEQLAQYNGRFKNDLTYVGTGIPSIFLNHPNATLTLTAGEYSSQNDAVAIVAKGTLNATGVIFTGPKHGIMIKNTGSVTVNLTDCVFVTEDHGIYVTASDENAERKINLKNTSATSTNGVPIYLNGGNNTVTIGTRGEADSGVFKPLSKSNGAILAKACEGAVYNLTINGGHFEAGALTSTVILNTSWSLTVNGGEFQHNTAQDYKHILELNGTSKGLTINGGVFSYNANPWVAGSVEAVEPTKANGNITEYVKAKAGYGAILFANFTLEEGATAEINGGKFNANGEGTYDKYADEFTQKRKATHVVGINYGQEGLVIIVNDINFTGAMFANITKQNSQLHINGGMLAMNTTFKNYIRFIDLNANNLTLTMTGGTMLYNTHAYIGFSVRKPTTVVNISGGIVEGGARQICFDGSATGATVNISGDATFRNPDYDLNDTSKPMIQVASGTMNISGGHFIVPMNAQMTMFYSTGGEFNITGGLFESSNHIFNINNKGGSPNVTISDGVFKLCETGDMFNITNGAEAKPGTFLITGGTFEASDTSGFLRYSSPHATSTFTIKGGTFTGSKARLFYMVNCKANLTIEGGTFVATKSSNLFYVKDNNSGWLTITGGEFVFENVNNKAADHALLNVAAKTESHVKIAGGVFVDQRKGSTQTFLKMNPFAEVIFTGNYKVYTTEQKEYLYRDYDNIVNGSLNFLPTVFKETWDGDGKQYYVQAGFATENDVLTVTTAQLRPNYDGFGIRWSASITAANLQALSAKGTLSYGTLIFPTEYLPKWYNCTDIHAALKSAATAKGKQESQVFVDVAAQNGLVTAEDGSVSFSASLVNIKKENEARSFTGIPYVLVTAANGTKTYYYGTTGTGLANMTYQIAVRNCLSDISEMAQKTADGRVYCYLIAEQTVGFRRIAPRMQTMLLMSLPEEMRAAFLPEKDKK